MTLCDYFQRAFAADWDTFSYNNSVMGAFFDLRENGLLDVILLEQSKPDDYNKDEGNINVVSLVIFHHCTRDFNI
jgi:hypothetical protein